MALELNCPACGAAVPSRLRYAKLLVCPHCRASLFLEDEAVKHVGERSALAEIPSILELGRRFEYRGWRFEPYGRVRFDYRDGFWDEWWVELENGQGRWVSVDEGDIAVESPVEYDGRPPPYESLAVGQQLTFAQRTLTVTERNEASCAGVEGELPEVIRPGDVHRYAHLSGPEGLLLTLEYTGDAFAVYKGLWIDPFDLRPG